MKKLRSIRAFIRIRMAVCLFLTILSVTIPVVLGFRNHSGYDFRYEYSNLISIIEGMVLDLSEVKDRNGLSENMHSGMEERTYIRLLILDSLERLERLTTESGHRVDYSPFRTLSEIPPGELEISFFQNELNRIRAEISALETRSDTGRAMMETFLIFTMAVGLVSILFLVFFLTRSLFRYYDFSGRTAEHLERLVRMESVPQMNLPIRWTEELKSATLLSELEADLNFQRKLLNLPVAGTLEDFLPKIFPILKRFMPCNRIGVAFLDGFRNIVAETTVTDYENIHLVAGFHEKLQETTLGELLSKKEPRIINDLEYYYGNVHRSGATRLLLREGVESSISMPLVFEGKEVGMLFASSLRKNAYTEKHARIIQWVTNILKAPLFYSYILQEMIAVSARSFADIVEKKDYETGNHLNRVSLYAHATAAELSRNDQTVTPKLIREIYWFASLHDIGKVGIPDSILLKPGRLSAEEFEHIRKHVFFGEEIIRKIIQTHDSAFGMRFFDTALQIISFHHEKWDGSGYPYGKKGDDIPLPGRLVALVDVFDALTSPRPYKPAYPFEEALDTIRSLSGSHFDPRLVAMFLNITPEIRRIYETPVNSTADPRILQEDAVRYG